MATNDTTAQPSNTVVRIIVALVTFVVGWLLIEFIVTAVVLGAGAYNETIKVTFGLLQPSVWAVAVVCALRWPTVFTQRRLAFATIACIVGCILVVVIYRAV
jgi:hypothetical protein